jgi:hypothetical protein
LSLKFLAEFYSGNKNINYSDKVPTEGFDMSPPRMNNFGLTAVPFIDQSAQVTEIKTKFRNIPAANPLVTIPATDISTIYDKKPQNIMVGGTPPQDTLEIPVWDPAELGTVIPSYEHTKLPTGEYLVKITYAPASPAGSPAVPAKECLCVMKPTAPG